MKESICKRCEHSRYCGASIIDKELTVMTGCSRFEERKPQTNADRIRGMTDEELARFIARQAGRYCDYMDPEEEEYERILPWLKSPVEVDR